MIRDSQQHEATILSAQLAELDSKIEALMEKRAKMRRRLNDIRAYTSILPPETLSIIFQHACELHYTVNEGDPHCPVFLGAVSTHWREVAYSTPSLWTRLRITVKNSEYTMNATLSLLRLYFENSGNRSISLRLDLSDASIDPKFDRMEYHSPGDISISEIFRYIFVEQPTKLCALYVDDFFLRWTPFFLDIGLLSNLYRIHIGWSNLSPFPSHLDYFPELPSNLLPQLRHVSLASSVPSFQLPFNQITVLELDEIEIDLCFSIIKQCINIVDCHCCRPLPSTEVGRIPTQPLTLNNVTCFGWTFGLAKWDEAFLKLVTLPKLERFRCENQGEDGISDDDDEPEPETLRQLQRDFFLRSPKLTIFERGSEHNVNWGIRDLCKDLPECIKELYLEHVEDKEAKLCMKLLTRASDRSTNVFPHLTVLSLDGFYWRNAFQGGFGPEFRLLVTMIHSRRLVLPEERKDIACLEQFCLRRNITDCKDPLPENKRVELQKFVDEGLKLVTLDSEGRVETWSPSA